MKYIAACRKIEIWGVKIGLVMKLFMGFTGESKRMSNKKINNMHTVLFLKII